MLIDTSIFIDLFRKHPPAVDFFINLPDEEILFSALTETELLAGSYCENVDYRERTLHFLSGFNKVIVENKVASLAGDLRRRYGTEIPDAIIAASALVAGSVLFTNNIKDFEKIKDLEIKKPY